MSTPPALFIYQVSEYEWIAALSLDDAKAYAMSYSGLEYDDVVNDDLAHELTDEEMDRMIFYDEENNVNRTFREHLAVLLTDGWGAEAPFVFAISE